MSAELQRVFGLPRGALMCESVTALIRDCVTA
eukprot:COSAG06_NODE_5250_length_3611_cov_1.496583_3_plen_32_part_00